MRRLVLTGFLATLLVGGATLSSVADSPRTTSAAAPNPVIVRLQMRDRTVIVTSTQTGQQYSVMDKAGEVLQADLSEDQFAEAYPELAEQLRPAIADPHSDLMMLAPVVE